MAKRVEIPAEQEARLRARLQAELDASEWASAENRLKSWLRQFGYQAWMVEQLGHLQLRRAAWREAGQSFFWGGVRGPHVARALDDYLGTLRHGRSRVPDNALPGWARGAFERYPEVVQRDLAAMGVKRKVLESGPGRRRDRTTSFGCGFILVVALLIWWRLRQ
jgi:hypothetical protein